MEVEVRYYYSLNEESRLLEKLNTFGELNYLGKFYEKTIQYNHPMRGNDFYSKEIDGRFRVRMTEKDNIKKCMITWKRRLNKTLKNDINKEEEIEVRINSDDYDNLINILTNILKLKKVESYERFRHVFKNNEVEIVVDIYPFAIALEIEAKCKNDEYNVILKWLNKLNLKLEDSYKLSWDDKYSELCKMQNKEIYSDVLFDMDMPKL